MKKAVVLLSGGIDSATSAADAKGRGYSIVAVTFNYGQRHSVEARAAERIAATLKAESHIFIDIPVGVFNSSLVKDCGIEVPKMREVLSEDDIPSTYVPARNILFLSYALAIAESRNADAVFIGANAVDYSGYPDCRPDFFKAFSRVSELGTRAGVEGHPVKIETPLINLTKAEIIRKGIKLGVDYAMTHSCYDPDESGRACGECDSCIIRKKGFDEAGVPDPTVYSAK